MKNSTNYNLTNIFKFFFSVLVIAGHTRAFNYINNYAVRTIFGFIAETAVPFFFICMGFSLAEKIDFFNPTKKSATKMLFVLKGIIKQYIIWSIVYLPLALVEYFQTGNSFIYSFFSYLKGFFLKGEHYNSWMLWYLLSFIYSFGFLYICTKRKSNFKKTAIISFIIGSLSILIKGFGIYNINTSNIIVSYLLKFMKLTVDNGRIFTGFIYIPLGIILQKYNLNRKITLLILVLSFLLVITNNYIVMAFSRILLGSSLFMLSIKIIISDKINTFCDYLRDLSTSNYYLHMWIFTIYYYIVYGVPTYSIDCFVFTTFFTVLIGVLYLVYKKIIIKKF